MGTHLWSKNTQSAFDTAWIIIPYATAFELTSRNWIESIGREDVAVIEAQQAHRRLARPAGDDASKYGSSVYKRVIFATLAAGIRTRRQVAQKLVVDLSSGEGGIDGMGVDTGQLGLEAKADKGSDELVGIAHPDRVQAGHAVAGQTFISILFDVHQKQVPKCDLGDAAVLEVMEGLTHAALVDVVGTILRDQDDVQWNTQGDCLHFEQLTSYPMHADSIELFGHGGQ
jgi:hypothetical protein